MTSGRRVPTIHALLSSPWISTLLAYGLSQVVVLAGAIIRIPLIAGALGETGYGQFVIVTSIMPAIQLMATGVAQSGRVVTAEDATHASYAVRSLRRTGMVEAGLVTALTALAVPVVWHLTTPDLALAVAAVTIGSALALPIAAYHGVLEGFGRTAASHLALTTNTLIGLPVLVVALQVHSSLLSVTLATALGFLAPYLTYRWLVRRTAAFGQIAEPGTEDGSAVRSQLTGAMTGWAMANVLVFVFDPLIIGSVVGSAAAGQYGLASRVTGLVTAAPVALGGLLTVWFSRMRVSEERVHFFRRLRLSMVVMGALGVALAIFSAHLGPEIGTLLSRSEVAAPPVLYLWLGVYGGLVCAMEPLISAFAAPAAARYRARVGLVLGVVNVVLSWGLAHQLGVIGPVVATVVCNSLIAALLCLRAISRPHLLTGGRMDLADLEEQRL